jgi:hypothetical protein
MKSRALWVFLVAISIWISASVVRSQTMMPPGLAGADTDHDGKISQDEFLAHCKARFAALDTDKDGFLSADEWAKYMPGKGMGMGKGPGPGPGMKKPMIQEGDEGEGE